MSSEGIPLDLSLTAVAPRKPLYSIPERRIAIDLIDNNDPEFGKYYSFIGNGQNTTEITVKFSRTVGGLGLANVSIYNLHPDVVNRFTQTSYLPRVPNKIKIYAAYKNRDEEESYDSLGQPIFEGYILWAAPVGITDVALQIEAMEEYPKINADVICSPEDGGNPSSTTSFDIIESVLGYVGLEVNKDALNLVEDKYRKPKGVDFINYSFSGKVSDFLNNELFRFNRMQYVIDGSTVYLRPNSDDENYLLSIYEVEPDEFISSKLRDSVNGYEGVSKFQTVMVGIPEVSYYGVKLRVLYTKNLKAGDRFRLISRLYPKFNFVYEIINIKYDLQLRGQNFYMDLECIRSRNSK